MRDRPTTVAPSVVTRPDGCASGGRQYTVSLLLRPAAEAAPKAEMAKRWLVTGHGVRSKVAPRVNRMKARSPASPVGPVPGRQVDRGRVDLLHVDHGLAVGRLDHALVATTAAEDRDPVGC